jgi:hypothetical protein
MQQDCSNDVNRHRRSAAADSQKNGEQWQSDVLLSRDQLLLANERQANKSRLTACWPMSDDSG